MCDVTDPNKDFRTRWEGIDVSSSTFLVCHHCCFPFSPQDVYQKQSKILLLAIAILFCVFLWWWLKYPQNIPKISFVNIERISTLYANVISKMDSVFEAYLGQDGGMLMEPDDIPKTNDPVWILGKEYNAIQELETIRRDVQSRLWCTYRRGFVPIGSPQLTSDKGWGCMLRCGQMVLGEKKIVHYWYHSGSDVIYCQWF